MSSPGRATPVARSSLATPQDAPPEWRAPSHDQTLHRRKDPRLHARAGGALRLLSAGAAGRRRHQGRIARRRRHALRQPRQRLGEARAGRTLGGGECRQALDHARPQEAQGARGHQAPGRQGRRGDGEFPAGRHGQARHRLRDAACDQSEADLLRRIGLRPGRPAARDGCLRRHDPGDVGPDVDHRLRGQWPDPRRLRRRRRDVGRDGCLRRRLGALPAHPHRQGPARRRRHDRRGDGLSCAAIHRAPDDRARPRPGGEPLGHPQADRQPVQDQGRLDGAGGHDRPAIPAPDESAGPLPRRWPIRASSTGRPASRTTLPCTPSSKRR